MTGDGVQATEHEQARFFSQLRDGFELASARTGEIVRHFRLGGTSVRLRFAGDGLIPTMVPGLAYPVDSPPPGPQCEICLWDSETTGIRLPPPPRPWTNFTGRGNIWGFDSSRYRSAYQWGEGSVNLMDRETRQAVFWVPSNKHLPAWVLASPLRSILHWWMELNGRQLVHAAAVGYGGRGVLIPGRGGSGKSSTSVACLLGGLDFISDDYLALALDPEPRVFRLYSTVKLDHRSLERYPEITRRCRTVYQQGFDKAVLFIEDGYSEQLKESLPLKLVLKPHITGVPETTLGPVESREIERALATETLVHLPHAGVHTVEFLDRVAHEIPRALLHLGTDQASIPAVIQSALKTRTFANEPRHRIAKRRPFVSVIVHFCDENHDELHMLADKIEEQGYPSTELIVVTSGPACVLANDVAKLSDNVRFLTFKDPVVNADAWNRGIRDSFAELVVIIEPGDRFPPGAIDSLVSACELDSDVAWVRGKATSSGPEDQTVSPLRGALIRKGAFRECGLFQPDLFLQGREHLDWLRRATEKRLTGRQLESVTLHAAVTSPIEPRRLHPKVALSIVRNLLDQRRQKTLE